MRKREIDRIIKAITPRRVWRDMAGFSYNAIGSRVCSKLWDKSWVIPDFVGFAILHSVLQAGCSVNVPFEVPRAVDGSEIR